QVASDVFPIGSAQIEQLKQPPHRRRETKEEHKIFARARPDRATRARPDHGIDHQNVPKPKRKKQISRPHTRQHPVQKPANRHRHQPDPTIYRPKSNFSSHVCETIGSPKCKPVRSKACRGELGLPLSSLKPRTVYYNAHPTPKTSPLRYAS